MVHLDKPSIFDGKSRAKIKQALFSTPQHVISKPDFRCYLIITIMNLYTIMNQNEPHHDDISF